MAKREIVTKTVLSKTRKAYSDVVSIHDPEVSKVLGCWLLNPSLQYEKRKDHAIVLSGSYDINLWVGCHENTTTKCIIQQQSFSYIVQSDVSEDAVIGEVECYAKWLSKPICTKAEYEQDTILLTVEQEFQAEWIGETKLRVELAEDEIDQLLDEAIDTQYLLK